MPILVSTLGDLENNNHLVWLEFKTSLTNKERSRVRTIEKSCHPRSNGHYNFREGSKILFIERVNKSGPSMDPCGTPSSITRELDQHNFDIGRKLSNSLWSPALSSGTTCAAFHTGELCQK